jgi:two-component system cell cycle sensor histidine kinase/response regulator CckA
MQSSTVPRGNEAVLLVAPDPETRALMAFMLGRLGYRVTTARSGLEAVRIHDEQGAAFELLLAEAAMPRVNGHDLAGLLRERRPDVRVLLLADARHERPSRRMAASSGVEFLYRPFTMAALAAGVRETLDAGRRTAMAANNRS